MMMNLKTPLSRRFRLITSLLAFGLLAGSAWAGGGGGVADEGFVDDGVMVTFTVEDDFDTIKENVVLAVQDRGLNIANELHASEMLNRTGPDLGYADNIYVQAETVEFCSAVISHKLAAANPANISLCPFAVSVYVLSASPSMVNVTYRHPVGDAASREAVAEVEALVRGIVEEAVE